MKLVALDSNMYDVVADNGECLAYITFRTDACSCKIGEQLNKIYFSYLISNSDRKYHIGRAINSLYKHYEDIGKPINEPFYYEGSVMIPCKKMNKPKSHYDWLDANLMSFFEKIGIKNGCNGVISAHGDKCYQYRDTWLEHGIKFNHGVAIYLAGSYYPFSEQLRETKNGWVAPVDWVISQYPIWKDFLEN